MDIIMDNINEKIKCFYCGALLLKKEFPEGSHGYHPKCKRCCGRRIKHVKTLNDTEIFYIG